MTVLKSVLDGPNPYVKMSIISGWKVQVGKKKKPEEVYLQMLERIVKVHPKGNCSLYHKWGRWDMEDGLRIYI